MKTFSESLGEGYKAREQIYKSATWIEHKAVKVR